MQKHVATGLVLALISGPALAQTSELDALLDVARTEPGRIGRTSGA